MEFLGGWAVPYERGTPVHVVTVSCVSRSCEHFPDGFDLHLLESGSLVVDDKILPQGELFI